jgi:hypothetical protein
MGWSNIDDKHKKKFDRFFVSCDEMYEMSYIKEIIKEEFPWHSEDAINNAILSCCASVPAPRLRSSFLACLKKKLGGV